MVREEPQQIRSGGRRRGTRPDRLRQRRRLERYAGQPHAHTDDADSDPVGLVGTGLPLVVTRTGGFAGFDDKVVIDTDGVATVSSRGKETVRCKLDQSLLATITAAAQQVDWAGLPVVKPTVRHPDDMIVAVTANGKTARLEERR